MKLIERHEYIKEIKGVLNTPDIKVVTGIRRAGKSKLMEEIIKHIKTNDTSANIIHINFNLSKFENIQEYKLLENYIESHYDKNKTNYIFVDEIQMCENFEKAINSLHAKEKFDIYVSGSNAFLQSSDLATLFVGRTYEVHVYPFSFNEYLKYYPSNNQYISFDDYIINGGMSGSYLYKTQDQKYKYINEEVFNSLIVRDIINKYKVRNKQVMDLLIDFLMDNIGNLTTLRSVEESLKAKGFKIDHKTVGKYIDYLCKAFAFYKVRRYDVRGKRYLNSEEKYYLADHSFRYARLGTKNMDYGHVLENIIAIELLRRDYELYVGKLYENKIDFVAIKQGKKTYIQVSYDISDNKTLNRELEPLLKIKDAYPKILIARTHQPEYQIEGIKIIDPADWLMH